MLNGEKTVGEIFKLTNMNQANISKHLGVLLDQGLVAKRKDGLFAYYRIEDDSVAKICELVCNSVSNRLDITHSEFKIAKKEKFRNYPNDN